ncbi:MAG: hypothetical protein L7H09_03855 [Acidilobus sp.]|nr:hypothetical protein [Acidilobus sp.]MCG2874402.1 hypothetical protein [Acidilobus sp.]MCG2895820.1 hypothetical protein [Acidilobus sp.]
MSVWTESPMLNIVYEALKELSKGGKEPVTESQILSYLARNGYSISLPDLVKSLMRLELLGLVYVSSSTKEERMVRLLVTQETTS